MVLSDFVRATVLRVMIVLLSLTRKMRFLPPPSAMQPTTIQHLLL
jgi:hypothetical protein